MELLQEGDIIELGGGQTVYATLPQHFLYANRKGVFDVVSHEEIKIAGELSYLAGRYVVYKTAKTGGGSRGPGDTYPSGHHVWCEQLSDRDRKVDFYQTGSFTAMIKDIVPIGKAKRQWIEEV